MEEQTVNDLPPPIAVRAYCASLLILPAVNRLKRSAKDEAVNSGIGFVNVYDSRNLYEHSLTERVYLQNGASSFPPP